MRKLMWFAVGFTAACAMGIYLQWNIGCLLAGLFCLFGCLLMFLFKAKSAKIVVSVLLGCAIGFSWIFGYHALYLSTAREHDGDMISLTITATDYSYAPSYGQAFDGYTEIGGKQYRVRCYLNEDRKIVPGESITGEFKLRYTSAGGEKGPTYHQGKGIFLIASQKTDVVYATGEPRWMDYPALWRQTILMRIEQLFPHDTSGFAKALLLGDTTGFSYRQDRDFQVSGLRHVVAVSGLHVSILFSLIFLVFGRQRVLNAVFGIPLLILFAAVSGFSPSIIRACLMQCLILLALLVDREYDPPTALAFSVLVILCINPFAITSVGFQLSVGCMIGIFAFNEPLRQYFLSFGKLKAMSKGKTFRAKLIRWCAGSISTTLSAMVVTTPLCAIHFGMVSLVGVLSNVLTLWIISFVFYGILLSCLLGAVWLQLGKCLAWITAWLIRYVLMVSGLLADFPLAAVYTDSIYIVIWLLFAYGVLVTFFILKKKSPGAAALSIGLMLGVCVFLSWLEPQLDDTRLSVIDVGQGQSILLQQGKEHYLVDCGGEHDGIVADTVTDFLLSQGIFRLDGVIITHYDTDHAGSVVNLLSNVSVDRIYMPDVPDSNGIREQIETVFSHDIHLVSETSELKIKDGKITLFPGKAGANDNESSMCVLFQVQNCDILITGDRSSTGERALLKQTQLPKLEILVAGHHGSHLATSLDLLMATCPETVVFSVGADNPYGHPRPEALERVARFGCDIYRTDLQGTIIFRR